MRFLIDENVPLYIADYLQSRGHEVLQSRDEVLPGSKDYVLAQYADANRLIVVTWNHKHFTKLIKRQPQEGSVRYPNASRLSFTCPVENGMNRLERYITLIEQEYQVAQECEDTRIIIEVRTEDFIIIA